MSVITSATDDAAYRANMAAIDALACPDQYRTVKAWGKLLGFTPEAVAATIAQAIADNAPSDATQKINGKWVTLADIANESTRNRVQQLAAE